MGKRYRLLLIGLSWIGFAFLSFWYYSNLEQSNRSTSIYSISVIIYNIGGKYLVSLIFGGVGLLFIIFGIMKFVKTKK